MRHVSNGLPLSFVLKSKELLLKSMIEMAKLKKLIKDEEIISNEIEWKAEEEED